MRHVDPCIDHADLYACPGVAGSADQAPRRWHIDQLLGRVQIAVEYGEPDHVAHTRHGANRVEIRRAGRHENGVQQRVGFAGNRDAPAPQRGLQRIVSPANARTLRLEQGAVTARGAHRRGRVAHHDGVARQVAGRSSGSKGKRR